MTTPEADPADVAEQQIATEPGEPVVAREVPLEADEGDAAEQAVSVQADDEYR